MKSISAYLFAAFAVCVSIVALALTPSVSATTTFRYSSVSDGPLSIGDYNSVSVYETGVGGYGFLSTPDGVRGGWSTRSGSGSFGYRYDMDTTTLGNQGGFTSMAVNTGGFRGSFVDGYGRGSYGSFVVGNSRYVPSSFNSRWGGGWNSYPTGISYPSYGYSAGYGYASNGWN